ncbi:hypothetical protein EJB05_50484, partial [Eragrostis curvula]
MNAIQRSFAAARLCYVPSDHWIGISVPDDSTNEMLPNFTHSRGVFSWHSRFRRPVHPNAVQSCQEMCLDVLYNISRDRSQWSLYATGIVLAMNSVPSSGRAQRAR